MKTKISKICVIAILHAILFPILFAGSADAYTYYVEDNGNANLTIYYGSPISAIAEYSSTQHALKLGVIADVYASATAQGEMYVRVIGRANGWVNTKIHWYLEGHIGGGGIGEYGGWITVKFKAYDETSSASTETILLSKSLVWGNTGTWYLNTTSFAVYTDHLYKLSLVAEVHAHAVGMCAVIADFGGIDAVWPESRIVWGYLDVPNTSPVGSGGGGSCPYVYVWDGQRYVMDNNLLPASETSNGSDVPDYYRLEQSLIPTRQGTFCLVYSLQIREFEHEHDYFDQVELLAVDHNSDVNVAVTPYGEILTYSNSVPPISAIDSDGIDMLSLLSSVDENYYQGYNESYVTLTFAPADVSDGVKLVIRSDKPPVLKSPVYVQTLNTTGDWDTVAVFHTRTYWATDIINMTNYLPDPEGDLKIRLLFVSTDKIDYVGLDTTPQAEIQVHQAYLLLAFHSTQGNVKPLLATDDQTYAELLPDEQIQLAFILPNSQNQQRTFILHTEGHYTTIL